MRVVERGDASMSRAISGMSGRSTVHLSETLSFATARIDVELCGAGVEIGA